MEVFNYKGCITLITAYSTILLLGLLAGFFVLS